MPWTGNIARTVGQALAAVGAIAVVLGLTGLVTAALIVKDAADGGSAAHAEMGDLFEGLVQGGMVLVVTGTLAIVAGIVSLGIGRALRDRLQRRLAATTPGRPPGVAAADAASANGTASEPA